MLVCWAARTVSAPSAALLCLVPVFFFPQASASRALGSAPRSCSREPILYAVMMRSSVARCGLGNQAAFQARDRSAGEPGVHRCLFLAKPAPDAEIAEPLADVQRGRAAGARDGVRPQQAQPRYVDYSCCLASSMGAAAAASWASGGIRQRVR